MVSKSNRLIEAMISYDGGDPKRCQHFIKVYQFAKMIGEREGLDDKTQLILERAAIVHDIGIRPALEKYGKSDGKLQEEEGPAPAREMLVRLGYAKDIVENVIWLIAHHHTYKNIQGSDYQILVEADFLVNLYEDGCDQEAIRHTRDTIFRTQTGIRLCNLMFGLES